MPATFSASTSTHLSESERRQIILKLSKNDDLRDSAPAQGAHAALPGTAEKIAVMAERARLKQALDHPGDLTITEARKLGFSFTVDANGYVLWQRPVVEEKRRALVLAAREALRRGER